MPAPAINVRAAPLCHNMRKKRALGRYYTQKTPFALPAFVEWAEHAGLPRKKILEPFAGACHLITALRDVKLCRRFDAYDIAPACAEVKKRDTIRNFPTGYEVCVTNPPWLARNSATRRRLPYPQTPFDDLYKHCLQLCLKNCGHVAALVPASFLQSGLFRERLCAYVLLHGEVFNDTENPVCLALFEPQPVADAKIYYDGDYIGMLKKLEAKLPPEKHKHNLRFNDPRGGLGFVAFDNTREPSIRFCAGEEVPPNKVQVSSRFITRIGGAFDGITMAGIKILNEMLEEYRRKTKDALLTPFKGMRQDGKYRRRMDFALARQILNTAAA